MKQEKTQLKAQKMEGGGDDFVGGGGGLVGGVGGDWIEELEEEDGAGGEEFDDVA